MTVTLSSPESRSDNINTTITSQKPTKYSFGVTQTIQCIGVISRLFPTERLKFYASFDLPKILKGEVWRLVTYPFDRVITNPLVGISGSGTIPFIFDMIGLQSTGRAFEKAYGSQGFPQIAALSTAAFLASETFSPKQTEFFSFNTPRGFSNIISVMDGALLSKSMKEEGKSGKHIFAEIAKFFATDFLFSKIIGKFCGITFYDNSRVLDFSLGIAFGWLRTPNKEKPAISLLDNPPIANSEQPSIGVSQGENVPIQVELNSQKNRIQIIFNSIKNSFKTPEPIRH